MGSIRFASLLAIIGASLSSLGGGCATAHPDFERYFNAQFSGVEYSDSPSHAEWMRFLATRYGCDTMALRTAVRSYTELAVGLPPCDIASGIPPEVVRAWKTPKGLREEWNIGLGARRSTVYLEGPTERLLQVTFIRWW